MDENRFLSTGFRWIQENQLQFSAPLCPKPPEVPFEGIIENNPVEIGYPDQHNCVVDGMVMYIYSFRLLSALFDLYNK